MRSSPSSRRARAEGTHAGQLQPGRSAFFASVWWHVDDPEQWPSYQPSAREALRREPPLYRPTSDVAADYLAFRDAFRRLAATLSLTTWELEYLCRWHHERAPREDAERGADAVPARPPRFLRRPIVRAPVLRERRAEPPARRRAGVSHTHLQWLLATMGRRLGCRVWVAANDHHRRWNGERLGDLSVKRLPPLGLHAASQRLVSLIDVVWLRDANQVVAAFEVECTSSIYSGLLRLADLGALSPNLTFPLYIVTPPERVEKVRRELSRPAFQRLGVPERCAFVASTDLIAHAESIMQWATGPDAIARLAQRAGAPPLDELFDDR
ncbi:MAG: hypothetical protein IRY91_17605 [Gemmatimonadaceae bacterium]|nr:hypothetical protein [Gemmatimonadaceae bacterium]